jgi:peptidoglycan/LPS O-acetylase OafA/YrhL
MSSSSSPDVTRSADPTPNVRSLGRVQGFNGIRGVGVLIVFVSHLEVILPLPTLLVIPGGTVSLDMFFVLSGFLITALLLREQGRYGRIGRLAFYRRRVLRLLPALLIVVVATALFAYLTHTWASTEVPSILSVTFYYSNYYAAASPNAFCANLAPGFEHLWSLSFEEQFYLVWPWITIALLTFRTRLRTVVIVLLSLITIVAVHRAVSYHGVQSWCALFHRTDTRADSILWGALVAHLWIRGKEPKRWIHIAVWPACAVLLYCFVKATLMGPFLYEGGFVVIDVCCAIVLLAVLDGRWKGRWLFELKPFVALGVVSYGFYLWHLPVFWAIRYYDTGWPYALRVVVAFIVTLAFTLASWFLLERPLTEWKGRLETRRHSATGDEPDTAPADQPTDPTPPSAGAPSPSDDRGEVDTS